MQALKALVIFLGVLIVIMMGVLAYGIAVKFGGVADGGDAGAPEASLGESWTAMRIAVPEGARVAETVIDGRRMVVRLSLSDNSQRYLVIDLDSGDLIGAIDLEAEGQ
ncbi:MAG: hypothetical protein JSU82_04605 [Rhodospirillales bacterium]|nr:MAG: hypothetical protein JSU82_04605 [Rhodospirillales bacterium]